MQEVSVCKDGQGGRETPGCFPTSINLLLIHIKPAGWRHVRGIGGWVTGGSRAQVCLRKKNK